MTEAPWYSRAFGPNYLRVYAHRSPAQAKEQVRAMQHCGLLPRAGRVLDKARATAEKAGVDFTASTLEAPAPYEAILATAKKKRCDLIVMASHGRRGLEGILLGSETHKVLTHGKLPVLVCR